MVGRLATADGRVGPSIRQTLAQAPGALPLLLSPTAMLKESEPVSNRCSSGVTPLTPTLMPSR